MREIKFDFKIAQAIEGKKVTVGDFLSHLLPMKSFEDVNSTIGTLTGQAFLQEIKPYFFAYEDNDGNDVIPKTGELTDEMNAKAGEIYNQVKETFKLRNIFCHEAAEPEIVDISAIYKGYISTKKFLEITNEYIWELIEPNRPKSNYEWSLKLGAELEKSEKELKELVEKITIPPNELTAEFLEIQEAWENYIQKRMDYVAKEWGGGSGTGIAMCGEKTYLTESRIEELQKEIENGRYNFEKDDF